MNLELYSYGATIELSQEEKEKNDLPLMIGGTSVKAGYIASKNFIIPENELDNIAKTLKEGIDGDGAYLLIDHGYQGAGFLTFKSVEKLVGKITDAFKTDNEVKYVARVEDEDLAKKIRRGLISSSSVGLRVLDAYCSICGRKYGDPECSHILGREYPEEKLDESVSQYLDDMGGVPKAALVGSNISGMEQSIVLYPAIKGATAKAFGADFSEETKKMIDEIESRKKTDENTDTNLDATDLIEKIEERLPNDLEYNCDEDIDEKELDSTEFIGKLSKIIESFNKDLLSSLNSEQHMDVDNDKLEEMTALMEQLKTENENIKNELETAKQVIAKYKEEEEKRHQKWRENTVSELASLRKEKGLPEKDYSNLSDDVLTNELELLSNLSISGTHGMVGKDADEIAKEEKEKEKELWRERIFGRKR